MDKFGGIVNQASAANIKSLNPAPPARPHTEIDDIEEALSMARSVSSRVRALADHLLGCEPEECSAAGGNTIAGGVLPRLAQSAQDTRREIASAMYALDRIQQRVP